MIRLVSAGLGFLLVMGCAAVDPNPNLGMRTADRLFRQGDCVGARQVVEPHAKSGEPWAQFRMGALLIDEKCPNKRKEDIPFAYEWITKAACYESKSPWERGDSFSVGPTGFFNARASSTNAARYLAQLFSERGKLGIARYFILRAESRYGPDEPEYKRLSTELTNIEAKIPPQVLNKIKE